MRQGTVKLERGGWRTWLCWLASFVVAVPVLWLAVGWLADLGLEGLMLQVCAAVTSLGLFWGLLSCFGTLFSSGDPQTVRWTLTEETLRLVKDVIPGSRSAWSTAGSGGTGTSSILRPPDATGFCGVYREKNRTRRCGLWWRPWATAGNGSYERGREQT